MPVFTMQRIDFKNSIIATKLFIVMISNLHLNSMISCALKLNYYRPNLNSRDEGF